MLLPPGKHTLRRAKNPHAPFVFKWASVSAERKTRVLVWVGEELVEEVYVGDYSPHTWWANNPLIEDDQAPKPGEAVVIEVGDGAIMRIESSLVADEPAP